MKNHKSQMMWATWNGGRAAQEINGYREEEIEPIIYLEKTPEKGKVHVRIGRYTGHSSFGQSIPGPNSWLSPDSNDEKALTWVSGSDNPYVWNILTIGSHYYLTDQDGNYLGFDPDKDCLDRTTDCGEWQKFC